MIPQLGASFLDRLIEMSTESNDVVFRQSITERVIQEGLKKASLDRETAYYQDLLTTIRGISKRRSSQGPVERVKSKSEAVLNDLLQALDDLQSIYQELSAQHLNPRTLLYEILEPAEASSERSIPLTSMALYGAIILFLTFFITVLGCFLHSSFRDWSASTVPETVPKTSK